MSEVILSLQPQPDHGVYTVFVKLGDTKIEVSINCKNDSRLCIVCAQCSVLWRLAGILKPKLYLNFISLSRQPRKRTDIKTTAQQEIRDYRIYSLISLQILDRFLLRKSLPNINSSCEVFAFRLALCV